jgi:hypothetical protein
MPSKYPKGLERNYLRFKANERKTQKELLDSFLKGKSEEKRQRILALEKLYVKRNELFKKIELAVNEIRQENPELLGILLFGSTINVLDRSPNDIDAILIFAPNKSKEDKELKKNIFDKLNQALVKHTGKSLHDNPLRANADKLISYFLDYHKSNESQVDPLGQLDPINFLGDKNIQRILRKAYSLAKRKTDSFWQHRITDVAIRENDRHRTNDEVL